MTDGRRVLRLMGYLIAFQYYNEEIVGHSRLTTDRCSFAGSILARALLIDRRVRPRMVD